MKELNLIYLKLFILLFTSIIFSLNSFCQSSDVEPNNTFETANPMLPGFQQSGSLSKTDQADYFVTNSFINGTVTLHVSAVNIGTTRSWIHFTCYDQAKDKGRIRDLVFLTDPGNTIDYTFKIDGLALNAFYVGVTSDGGSHNYSFNYAITNTPLYNDVEPDDNFSQAISLNSNEVKGGQVSYTSHLNKPDIGGSTYVIDYYDYYKIVAPISGVLNLHLNIKSNQDGTYPQLTAYDKDEYAVNQIDIVKLPYGHTAEYNLSVNCQANETYYVRIGAANGASTYELSYDASNLPITVNVINPSPDMVNSDGTLSVNTSQIDLTKTIAAAATDGVTKLLLVTNASFPLTFSVANGDGLLSNLSDQKSTGTPITIMPDENGKVVAVYTVPDGYGNTNPLNGRNATITIANASSPVNSTTASIRLVTPPVVLVHGMWSDPDVWNKGKFSNYLRSQGITNLYFANYSDYSSMTFYPDNIESIQPRIRVQEAIDQALLDYKNKQIAAIQVDVVGHSLGGLMTRSISQDPNFTSNKNYYKGYVHKLITLGTPHRGSPFGPELWNVRNQWSILYVSELNLVVPYKVSAILSFKKMPIGTCHRDFAITSDAIAALKEVPLYKNFAITANHEGNGAINGEITGYEGMEALCQIAFHKTFEDVMKSRCNTGTLPNDLIVPLTSQTGYIDKTALYYATSHSTPGSNTETNSPIIQGKVAELLLSNNASEFSTRFPAPNDYPIESCDNQSEKIDTNQSAKDKQTLNRLNGGNKSTGNEYLQIISPTRGSIYRQGIDTTITLSYEVHGGALPTNALFMIENAGWFTAPITAPYSVAVTLPKNVQAGTLNVVLMASDTTGVMLADTSHITILPDGILDTILVAPSFINLDSAIRQSKLLVQGQYISINGTQTIDIGNSSAGTTYTTQKNGSIVSVSADGIITAVSIGTDTIIISNNGKTVKVLVIVDSNFIYKTLYPNIIDFADIPNKTESDEAFALDAIATSGENVSFTLVSGPVEIVNGVVVIKGTGLVTIQATSGGNAYFDSAAPVIKTFYINGALPLQLLTFTGSLINNDVLLNWTTSNEQNTTYFIIGRSTDGTHFSDVGTVNATGNGAGNYYFKDISVNTITTSPVYYRLKEVNKDGKEVLSNIIPITLSNIKDIIVYPNPAKRVINILLNEILTGDSYLKLYDMTGREMMNQKLTNGLNQQIKLPALANGSYRIVIWNKGKVIKQQTLIVSM